MPIMIIRQFLESTMPYYIIHMDRIEDGVGLQLDIVESILDIVESIKEKSIYQCISKIWDLK